MNLEVIFVVNRKPSAEDVAHDDDVRFRVVDCDAIHSQILRQQRVRMPLHDVLRKHTHRPVLTPMQGDFLLPSHTVYKSKSNITMKFVASIKTFTKRINCQFVPLNVPSVL